MANKTAWLSTMRIWYDVVPCVPSGKKCVLVILLMIVILTIFLVMPLTNSITMDPRIDSHPDPRLVLPDITHPTPPDSKEKAHVILKNYTSVPLTGTCRRRGHIDPYEAGRGNGSGNCGTLHFSTTDALPLVALASPPGSGNTWTRHLVQLLTGLYTGAVYNNKFLRHSGFAGEGVTDRRVVVIKTHTVWNCSHNQPKLPCPKYDKAILIVRDPHETVLAEFNRQYSQGRNQTGIAPSALFNSARWRTSALHLAEGWYHTMERWTRFGNYKDLNGCLHILSYRRLKTHLREELVSLGHFLGVNESYLEGPHMDCVVSNARGKFKRTIKPKQSSHELFDKRMNNIINTYKERVNLILNNLQPGGTQYM